MKSITPELAIAAVFAVLSFILVLVSEYTHNPYFLIAAGTLVVATYVMYPPMWLVSLRKLLIGSQTDKSE